MIEPSENRKGDLYCRKCGHAQRRHDGYRDNCRARIRRSLSHCTCVEFIFPSTGWGNLLRATRRNDGAS